MTLAAVIVGAGTMLGAGAAAAQSDPYVRPPSTADEQPEVLSETTERPPSLRPEALGASFEPGGQLSSPARAGSSLALTGGDVVGIAVLGGVAVAAGTALTGARRRTG